MAETNYGSDLTKREQYEVTRSALLRERSSFEAHWTELASYIKPRRIRMQITDRNKGDRRNQKIIDSTGTFAARTLQSGLHAGLTSPARPWFKLSVTDPQLKEFGPVKDWLYAVTNRMHALFLRSNLYNSLPVCYGDMGVFAVGAMGVIEDDRTVMRTYPYPVGSYAVGVSDRGIVDMFLRDYQMTVRQIIDRFGRVAGSRDIDWTNISQTVKNLWTNGNSESTVEITWMVAPNAEADPSKLHPKYMPFASCYFEKGGSDGKFLKESGFQEFPILVPRWDTEAENSYGTDSPGMISLGDIKALQLMQRRKAQAVELMINPSLSAPTSARNQKISLLPGDVSYYDQTQRGDLGIKPIREVRMSVAELTSDIQDTRQLIRRAFFEDLFLMLAESERTQITAREVDERHEEKLLALGPVLDRTNDELLDPLIDRTYGMMDRAGMLPPAPPDLEGVVLQVEYVSLLAQAQKLVSVGGHDRFFRAVVPLIQFFPGIRNKINVNQAVNDYADLLGVNPKLIVSDEDADAATQQQEQAAQQQRQMEQAAIAAKGARDLSQAPMNTDSALSRVTEGAQQQ